MSQLIRHFLPHEVYVGLAELVLSERTQHMPNTMCTWPRLGSKYGRLGVGEVQLPSLTGWSMGRVFVECRI